METKNKKKNNNLNRTSDLKDLAQEVKPIIIKKEEFKSWIDILEEISKEIYSALNLDTYIKINFYLLSFSLL